MITWTRTNSIMEFRVTSSLEMRRLPLAEIRRHRLPRSSQTDSWLTHDSCTLSADTQEATGQGFGVWERAQNPRYNI